MSAYCMGEFGLPKDAAYKRIQAARTAREFPAIFERVADGRLNLSGVCLLAPYLTMENAAELLTEASGKSKSEIEVLLARRFPRSESMGLVEVVPGTDSPLAPGQVERSETTVQEGLAHRSLARAKAIPIAAERYSVQLT